MLFLSFLLLVQGPNFDLLASTPVGSWQVREETMTDKNGKQTLTVFKTALVDSEERGGETHYWMEVESQTYKLRGKKRKAQGDLTIIKALVAESAFKDDPANIMKNLYKFGEEIILQTGDNDPMKITGAGALAQSLMQAFGMEVNFEFSDEGLETVSVPGGEFKTAKWSGEGDVKTKVMFQKIEVHSKTTIYLSSKIPFGTVKAITQSEVNGEPQSSEAVLIEYGTSGATTQITKEPVSMPNLFGQ